MYVTYEILLKNTVPLLLAHFRTLFLYCLVILAYRAATHDGGFAKGWNGAFILQNCPLAC